MGIPTVPTCFTQIGSIDRDFHRQAKHVLPCPNEYLRGLEHGLELLHLVLRQDLEVLTVSGSGTEEEGADDDVIDLSLGIPQGRG